MLHLVRDQVATCCSNLVNYMIMCFIVVVFLFPTLCHLAQQLVFMNEQVKLSSATTA